jgi:hypothetical protein
MTADETPLQRLERELASRKALHDIVVPVVRPRGLAHLEPWAALDERSKELLLLGVWIGMALMALTGCGSWNARWLMR